MPRHGWFGGHRGSGAAGQVVRSLNVPAASSVSHQYPTCQGCSASIGVYGGARLAI